MKLILIAAVSVDGIIGDGNKIPWHIPEDFKHYRETTIGNMLIVGATTFLTLPPKAHEGREFIILNNGERFNLTGTDYFQFSRIDTVLDLIYNKNVIVDKAYVIGGASIYDAFIDYCDEAIITWVETIPAKNPKLFPIDKLFTNFVVTNDGDWQESKSGLLYKFTNYKRKDDNSKKTNQN